MRREIGAIAVLCFTAAASRAAWAAPPSTSRTEAPADAPATCPIDQPPDSASAAASARTASVATSGAPLAEPRTTEEHGLIASALGLDLLSRGEIDQAVACLKDAERALPDSAEVARDLAIAHAQRGRMPDALVSIDRAIRLGDRDPEAHELRAMLLAELGRSSEAIRETRLAQTWESELIAASLGDGPAAYHVAELASEETWRGALASLVLGAHAATQGELTSARLLTDLAQQRAEGSSSPLIVNAARALDQRLDERAGLTAQARLRTAIDHSTNPTFASDPSSGRDGGVRLALSGEGALEIPLATARLDAALRIDQHVFLTSHELFRRLDLTAFTIAASVEYPISKSPSAALIAVRARFTDTFGDLFRVHYATSIEGGPNLVLPLAAAWRLDLGFYGIATDFIDVSPPDARISSINRDRVGQRATIGLRYRGDWIDARGELMFLHDTALGAAFNAIGGAAGGRIRAYPGGGIVIATGVALTARQFGPVGDRSIIGPASTRTELRTVVELGLRVPILPRLYLVLDDVWIHNGAREGHGYTDNVLSAGMEQVW